MVGSTKVYGWVVAIETAASRSNARGGVASYEVVIEDPVLAVEAVKKIANIPHGATVTVKSQLSKQHIEKMQLEPREVRLRKSHIPRR